MSHNLGSIYVVEKLKPLTTYEFRFSVTNDVGQSNWGTNLEQTTPARTAPNQPTILVTPDSEYEQSVFSNQYELGWLAPPDNGEPIDTYAIKYCQIRRIVGEWEVLDNTCTQINVQGRTRQYLRGLSSDTFYRVELKAHNIMGYSTAGVATFRTARGKSRPSPVKLSMFLRSNVIYCHDVSIFSLNNFHSRYIIPFLRLYSYIYICARSYCTE